MVQNIKVEKVEFDFRNYDPICETIIDKKNKKKSKEILPKWIYHCI